jgi:hypothetical protein
MDYQKPNTWKDWGILLTAWATAIAVFLKAAFGWSLEGLVGPFVSALLLTFFFSWNVWGIWKNTYVSKKAQEQAKLLQQNKLK